MNYLLINRLLDSGQSVLLGAIGCAGQFLLYRNIMQDTGEEDNRDRLRQTGITVKKGLLQNARGLLGPYTRKRLKPYMAAKWAG